MTDAPNARDVREARDAPDARATPDVMRWDEQADGALSERTLAAKLEALGYSVNRYTYPPGTQFGWHEHEVDKIDAVLRGRFAVAVEIGGEESEVTLGAGDALAVPRGVRHRAWVVGEEPVISLDAVRARPRR